MRDQKCYCGKFTTGDIVDPGHGYGGCITEQPVKLDNSALRAQAAIAAMQGFIAHHGETGFHNTIVMSLQFADALIEELNKKKNL